MAQSFLNNNSLPLGLRNNNPGNLRPLPNATWLGEIEPDRANNFSRFKNVAYGIRAMITDITGDIVKDGDNTIRKLVNRYAPSSDNNPTTAYINYVSSKTGIGPDEKIEVTASNIEKIIKAKMAFELGETNAKKITGSDIFEAFNMLSPQVKSWINYDNRNNYMAGFAIIAALIGIVYWLNFS